MPAFGIAILRMESSIQKPAFPDHRPPADATGGVSVAFERITELDGWRGLSILLVLLGHSISFRFFEPLRGLPNLLALGDMLSRVGVHVFFCISGFVITGILLRQERTQRLPMRWFYIRRAFKILPPLTVFLLALATLSGLGQLQQGSMSLLPASLFLCNTSVLGPCGFFTEHTWSLAVEEQYYLVFPAFLLVTSRRLRIPLLASLLSALLLCSAIKNCLHLGGWIDNFAAFACIVVGALIALCGGRLQPLAARVPAASLVTPLILLLLLRAPHSQLSVALYTLLGPPLIGAMMLLSMAPGASFGRMLNSRGLQAVGAISYSLYIWQQLFLARSFNYASGSWLQAAPWAVLFIAAAAYWCLERPMTRLGRRLSEMGRVAKPVPRLVEEA